MPVRFHLFGSPKVDRDGESFALPFERRSQLLAFLALKRAWVGRAELAAMLWPEQESKLAYTNLRKTLFRLQSLPWAGPIESQGNAARFEAETDVFDFEQALRENRVSDALSLRRGELLAGYEDDSSEAWSSWLGYERERLRVAWRAAALGLLATEIDPGEGIDLSARLLEADPLDESALRAHMRWLAQSGQAARARQAYRAFEGRLAQDLALAPGAELKALHDSLGAPLAPPAPEAASDDGFIGRSVERQRIASQLARDDCRLLCIVGPGGVGKTRLAQRAMQELAPGFEDGVAFVALEDIASPGEIAGRLAREIGVALAGSSEPLDQVIKHLHHRHMLLVLDNFEQLVAGASIPDKLLQACPRLKIIVTSRIRLSLAAEWSLPLEGLPFPEAEDRDRLEAFDAVRLFVNAARRAEPALVPAVEANAIVEICRQVEGLPLALELAAAWTRVLGCEAIALELRQGTELLRAVDPTQPARHASIQVVFDQSWQLLAPSEREALARLSVFRGGFTAEAARAVAAASLPVLGALTDKSLLRKEGARTFLHPLVHQLAAARLGEGEVRLATEESHAHYFHRMLVQVRRAVEDADRDTLAQLDAEFENCRGAWRWSVARGRTEDLGNGAFTLLHYCDHRGRLEECLAMLNDALESRPKPADPKYEALLSSAIAHMEYRMDRYGDAMARAARALAASRPTRDEDTRLQSFKVLGGCSLRLGRHADARRYYKQALLQSPPHIAAGMLDNLALVEKAMGRYDESMRMSMQSLVQHRQLGDIAGEALCRSNLSALQMDLGQHEAAAENLKAALELCERRGLVYTRSIVLTNLVELALKTGDLESARAHAAPALEVTAATGNRAVESWLRLLLARVALQQGDLPAARSGLRESLEVALAIGRPSLVLEGVVSFAEILAAQGEIDCARRVLALVAEHPSTVPQMRDAARARLAQWGAAKGELPAWPHAALGDLAHRIVLETAVSHAPLIASLHAAR